MNCKGSTFFCNANKILVLLLKEGGNAYVLFCLWFKYGFETNVGEIGEGD